MKLVLILVVVSIVAAQIVYAQDGSSGKSDEPQNHGKSAEHKTQKAGGAAAIHRFRRSPMPQDTQASGSVQVSAGGQAGGNSGQLADKAKQFVDKAKQMAKQMKDKLHQMGGHGQTSGQSGQAGNAS